MWLYPYFYFTSEIFVIPRVQREEKRVTSGKEI